MKHEKERRNLVQLFNIHFPNGAGQGLPRWMMNGVSDLFSFSIWEEAYTNIERAFSLRTIT